jgi:predicted transcriptional regulator
VDLKEFADLRNAIVHERTDGHVLAEPNDRTAQEIENLALRLLDPPKVTKLFQREVHTFGIGDPIARAVQTMLEHSFSQVPIYDEGAFVGLLTANSIARWLGATVAEDISSLSDTRVSDVLDHTEDSDNVSFLGRNSTLCEVLERFRASESLGKRLEAILITENGKPSEALLGIVTIWDLPRIHKAIR